MSDTFFVLPDGSTATELEVVIPVIGRRRIHASLMQEVDECRDLLNRHGQKQRWTVHGRLKEQLASVTAGYERVAAEALDGAKRVRDDMHAYLRSVVFVLETIEGDHISHGEKNARVRGAIALLERHIAALRQERFAYHESLWRNTPDLFRWDSPERRLREEVESLRRENAQLHEALRKASPEAEVE